MVANKSGETKETLQLLAEHLILALQPLEDAFSNLDSFQGLMLSLGWETTNLPKAYKSIAALVTDGLKALRALGGSPDINTLLDLLGHVEKVFKATEALKVVPSGVSDIGAFKKFLSDEFPGRLFELLLTEYLATAHADAYHLFEMIGLITCEMDGNCWRTYLHYDAIPELISDPMFIPKRVYGWGTDDFDFERIADHGVNFLAAAGLPVYLFWPGMDPEEPPSAFNDFLDDESGLTLRIPLLVDYVDEQVIESGFALLKLPPDGNKKAGLLLQPLLSSKFKLREELTKECVLTIQAGTNLDQTFGLLIRPNELDVYYPGKQNGKELRTAVALSLDYTPTSPRVLLGHPLRSRLAFKGGSLGLGLETKAEDLDLRLDVGLKDLTVVISAADLDGFFKSLLGGTDITTAVPFNLTWSKKGGLSFTSGVGFEIVSSPHTQIGPFTLTGLQVRAQTKIDAKQPANLDISAGIDLKGDLGPVSFTTQDIGIRLALIFKEGNAGPFDIQAGFKAPKGLGIVVNAGPVTGGGFLSFDETNGRYAGILQLQIYDIAIKAIGLLDTRLPGGEEGFSFLLILTAEFPSIQLGFGFTLNGIGGLAGIHRTIVTQALQAGIRSGSANQILFPDDPVRNANQILSNLRTVFPPTKDRYVFGPMALIGWGTPTIISAKVGIILELPEPVRLIILGEVSACLPDEKNALVKLNLSVLGVVDFGQKLLSIDASLHDSHILAFTISGDMAMRLAWGDPPSFALSIGGLNPHFQPPVGFPKLRRVTLALGQEKSPRLSLQAYLAITSNTVQLGAQAELFVDIGLLDLNVYGMIGFDVLLQFSPFYFIADLGVTIALRRKTDILFGIYLEAHLSGPFPLACLG